MIQRLPVLPATGNQETAANPHKICVVFGLRSPKIEALEGTIFAPLLGVRPFLIILLCFAPSPLFASSLLLVDWPEQMKIVAERTGPELTFRRAEIPSESTAIEIFEYKKRQSTKEMLLSFRKSAEAGQCELKEEVQKASSHLKSSKLRISRTRLLYKCPKISEEGLLDLIEVPGGSSLVMRIESSSEESSSLEKWSSWLENSVALCHSSRKPLCQREMNLRQMERDYPIRSDRAPQETFYFKTTRQWTQAQVQEVERLSCSASPTALFSNILLALTRSPNPSQQICFQYEKVEGVHTTHCLPLSEEGLEQSLHFSASEEACEKAFARTHSSLMSSHHRQKTALQKARDRQN